MTALRELAERWKGGTASHDYEMGRQECADELLSILEGDGGEAGEVDDDTVKRAWLAFDGQFFEDRLSPLSMERMRRTISTALPHPARSGVVRDEDVWGSLNAWDAKAGYSIIERMRAALEHFAKGERHER